MAIEEQPKENLLRDAVQFPRRIVFTPVNDSPDIPASFEAFEEVFIGIRKDSGWSIYLGQDYVLQFTSGNKLRRLFWQDQKYAARGGELQQLTRDAIGGRMVLTRKRLEPAEQSTLNMDCQRLLTSFVGQLELGGYRTKGQVPVEDADASLAADCLALVQSVCRGFEIARSPRAGR